MVFVNDRYMKALNRRFLSHDHTTDVLSFPLGAKGEIEGELYVNLDRAKAQAKRYKISYSEETRRLLVHGALHLVGYRDSTKAQKKAMALREQRYLG